MGSKKKIAVIGGGVSGISAALMLHNNYDVEIFEKERYVGGHTNTIAITEGTDKGLGVDTGFIVCNNWTYPNFHAMMKKLDVEIRDTCMSFGYHDEVSGFQYAGTDLNGLFADRINLLNPKMYRLLKDVYTFNKNAKKDLEAQRNFDGMTLKSYLDELKVSDIFIMQYLVPIGGAIWSSSNATMLDFPASLFLHFFKNHGLLNILNRPQWQTVAGGSSTYVKKFLKIFNGLIKISSKIEKVSRNEIGVTIHTPEGVFQYDQVVFATHADQILPLLENPTSEEITALTPWNYIENHTVLHTDTSVMPSNKRAWASWNFTKEPEVKDSFPVSVTYDMGRLQGLKTDENYLVTLNRNQAIDPSKVIREFRYFHPNFDLGTLGTRKAIWNLNGSQNTFYTGSYMGYGFHEDAVKSSVDMVNEFFDGESFE